MIARRSAAISAKCPMVAGLGICFWTCPPESGGQHDRDEVEIVRGVVPKPQPCGFPVLEPPLAGSASRSRCPPDSGGQLLPPVQSAQTLAAAYFVPGGM